MRPIVYSLTASVDGYINREDGTLDWISTDLGMPPEQFFREKFSAFDAVIIGRKAMTRCGPCPARRRIRE
ncbi:MAG TPA: dihydrofolate reductase family protein [Bryobacteraceae bacterium]|jgi:dihydrofolate reductase|nr:dihydrofolate reductase family protein [Bryobacteraceae bacterium]